MNFRPVFCIVGWLLTICLVMLPNYWTISLMVLFIIRIIALRQPKFLVVYLIVQIIAALSGLLFMAANQTLLSPAQQTLTVMVKAPDIKVDGDLLALRGEVQLADQHTEKIQIYYWLKDEAEQQYWLHQTQAIAVTVTGVLEPADANGNRGLFDFKTYLQRQRIHWLFQADTIGQPQVLTGHKYWLSNYSRYLTDLIAQLNNKTVASYVLSLLFNKMDTLSSDMLTTYQQIGMIHLFSISGFHATYLIGLLKHLCLRAGMLVEHFNWFAVLVLLLYGAVLGWPYGMIRVIVSYLYNLMQEHRGQQPSTLIGTSWGMWFIMAANPGSIFTLSFQLTFALSFVVIMLHDSINQLVTSGWLREVLLSFVCTQITIPFLVVHVHSFSWATLVFNYFYSAFFSLVMFPGLILVLVLHLFSVANHLMFIQQLLAAAILQLEKISLFIQKLTFLNWTIGITPAVIIALLVLATFNFYIHIQSRAKIGQSLLLYGLALLLLYGHPYLTPYGRVIALDVGQGDSLLIELPFQAGTYLVDLAGQPRFSSAEWAERETASLAEREIVPSLRAEGIRKIDGIFITHSDFDHLGSLAEIAAVYPIMNLYLPIGMQEDGPALAEIAAALQHQPDTAMQWLTAGDSVKLNGQYQLSVLMPLRSGEGENEDSLVLHGQFGPQAFLFTGDIVGPAETQLAQIITDNHLEVDVLKVAHHGSDYSTPADFLARTQPEQAWISVGEANRYGHPGERLLADLAHQQVETLRTDQDGAIHYIFKQNSFTIKTVKSK